MYKTFKIFILIIFGIMVVNPSPAAIEEKIKIGLLVPITGEDKKIGQQIVKSTRIALNEINTDKLEIYIKDTGSNPNQTVKSAIEFREMGIRIVIGPVFYKSLTYLDEVQEIIFLSLTNKTLNLSNNIISAGINATSQLNTINKFLKLNEINKTIFLTPKLDYEAEIKKAVKQSKIKIFKHYSYDTEPTKLTSQIEKITNYKIRKQNLADEVKRVENSDLADKEKQLKKLEKKYTIGKVNFDAVIISDFNESLKSVITSLLYTDVANSAVFTVLYVVIVPVIAYFLFSKKIHKSIWPSVLMCLVGGLLLSEFDNLRVRFGDSLVVIGAFFWAFHIVFISKLLKIFDFPITIATFQCLIAAVLSAIPAISIEFVSFELLSLEAGELIYAGILSSGFAFLLQIIALQHLSPAPAAIIFSLEGVFASIAAWILLDQYLNEFKVLGIVIILTAVIFSQLAPIYGKKFYGRN